MNKDKALYILLAIKTLIAFVLSYNLIAKSDGGALVNALGNFIIGGNVFLGLFIFIVITLLNFVPIGITFRLLPKGLPRRLLLQSSFLDLILLAVVFYYGMQLCISDYLMPFADAICKMAINISGFGLLLYLINFVITIPYCIISVRGK